MALECPEAEHLRTVSHAPCTEARAFHLVRGRGAAGTGAGRSMCSQRIAWLSGTGSSELGRGGYVRDVRFENIVASWSKQGEEGDQAPQYYYFYKRKGRGVSFRF